MKLCDLVSRVITDARNLTDYALDPQNPIGRQQAEVFERCLGFTRSNDVLLLQQIDSHALDADAYL